MHPPTHPIHPPKIPKMFYDVLNALPYDTPPLLDYQVGTKLMHKTCADRNLPLKPITQSILSYDALLAMASQISTEKAQKTQHLFNLLRNKSSFLSLFHTPPQKSRSVKKSAITTEDLEQLKSWGTAIAAPRSFTPICPGFAFKVPKSDPKWARLILDCSQLNEKMMDPPSFHLPPPIVIISIILSSNYAFCADFAAWFFQHLLDLEISSFFSFRVGCKWNHLLRLAQGWKFSPSIAQNSSEILATDPSDTLAEFPLTLVWIDNVMMGGESLQTVEEKRQRFLARCREANAELGEITEVKREIEYVGGEFDLINKRWRVKQSWVQKALPLLQSFPRRASPRRIWAVLGLILWFLRLSLLPLTLADPLIFFVSRLAKMISHGEIGWTTHCEVWPTVLECISSIIPSLSKNEWRILTCPLPISSLSLPCVFSDASTYGGAAVWQNAVIWSCQWNETMSHRDILLLECLAWEQAVLKVLESESGFISVVDNEALFFSLIKSRSKSFAVNLIIQRVFEKIAKKKAFLFVGWVPSEEMPADHASRGKFSFINSPHRDRIRVSRYPVCCASHA